MTRLKTALALITITACAVWFCYMAGTQQAQRNREYTAALTAADKGR